MPTEEEREVKISDYYYKKSDIDTQMSNKVDKDGNKVLSDNNYTNAEKTKLSNMTPADYITTQSLSSILSSYVVTSTLNNYYTQSEIDNIISTKISKSTTVGLVKNDGTIDTTTYLTTHQDISGKENLSNKVSSWNGTTSDTRYPSEKLVKDSLDNKADTSDIPTKVSDLTNDSGFLTSHQDISGKEDSSNKVSSWSVTLSDTHYPSEKLVKDSLDNKISISQTNGLVKNDGTIDTNTYINNSALNNAIGSVYTSISSTYQTKKVGSGKTYENKNVVTDSNGNISVENKPVIPTNVSDLTNDAGYLTQHQSLDSKTVTVEKQSIAETGYIATYVIKQGGTALSPKINIPKDYLVKSASIGTCSTADSPVTGYVVGDKYLDFVINTKESSETDEHLYILVSDLIDTYIAGNGLTLSNNEFSISNGDISLSMLASGVQTSLGYADTFHSSPAAGITSTQISNWDTMVSTSITTSDIDNKINQALDDLAELIYPTNNN